MTRLAFVVLVATTLSSGCWFKKKQIELQNNQPHLGGEITVQGCNYTVKTREGATAPEVGQPLLGADPKPFFIHLGLASDASTSVVIQWRTNFDTLSSTVQYGVGTDTSTTFEGFTFDYDSDDAGKVRMHEAHLCGLQPDTEYSYRVGGQDEVTQAWSSVFTFRTAPANSATDAEIVVLALGDTRDGYDIWKMTLESAFAIEKPDLILFSGDAVTIGPQQIEWESWWMATEAYFPSVPVISAHGNHDINSINYFSQFAMPGDEENFALDYGPLHLTVLNDTPIDMTVLSGATLNFLQSDLQATMARPWRIVLHHRPIWSASTGHGGDPMLRTLWQPTYDQYHPDLVINGHDHDYERTKPMRNNEPKATAADGTIFVVAGTSGAPLYEAGKDFWTEYSEKTNSFVILKLRQGQLTATAYRPDGSQLDTFAITK